VKKKNRNFSIMRKKKKTTPPPPKKKKEIESVKMRCKYCNQ